MSKKTLDNMELIIIEMDRVLDVGHDFKGIKALSHSYETLLHQLKANHEDFKEHKLTNKMLDQKKLIEAILNILETISIPKLLKSGNYLEVNHLTTTVERINHILPRLKSFVAELYKYYNPSVVIVSKTNKSHEKLNSLLEESVEEILYHVPSKYTTEIRTDKFNYVVLTNFNTSYRDRRADIVYIDKDMNNEEIKMAMSFVKPNEGKFEMYC